MSHRIVRARVVPAVIASWVLVVSIGCPPPEPPDVDRPVSPGSTAGIVPSAPELPPTEEPKMEEPEGETGQFPVQKTDEEWKALLTPEQYQIARLKGTERAFTGKYWNTKTAGTYECVCCGQALFSSNAKFDSGCGWPSFFQEIEGAIVTQPDHSIPPPRVEIMCSKCGAHLGHVFKDGPPPTGIRHCVNSASVKLVESGADE